MNRISNRWKPARPGFPIPGTSGFTLIELLVVIAIIGLLAALVTPAVGRALGSGHRARCVSNLREIAQANQIYADDRGVFVAAADDIWGRNLHRWHGRRTRSSEPFSPADGPLVPYLGTDKSVRQCGAFKPEKAGFEAGCGGYGYNVRGVGSQTYLTGSQSGAAQGMKPEAIQKPAETVFFTDAAFLEQSGGRSVLIEYSFAESPQFVSDGPTQVSVGQAQPSIHFRHGGRAAVIWCDGHTTFEEPAFSQGAANERARLGWFGPRDNSLFDPY